MDDTLMVAQGFGPWVWGIFCAVVILVIAFDLGLTQKKASTTSHAVGVTGAMWRIFAYTVASALFAAGLGYVRGYEDAMAFVSGYIIEQSLSLDNLFVFVLIFRAFNIANAQAHRILIWGVLGALVMRGLFIAAGAALLDRFSWLSFVLGAFLVLTGLRLLIGHQDPQAKPERLMVMRLLRHLVPMAPPQESQRGFWVRHQGRLLATPALVALLAVELSDILFAIDSVPAIFSVTREPFLVFAANVFAILGLRSMFFVLKDVLDRVRSLGVGLSLVLIFVGSKMLVAPIFDVSMNTSLLVIVGLLAVSFLAGHMRKTEVA